MKKYIAWVLTVFLLCTLLLADAFYWTLSFPLAWKLPQREVTKVQLWYYDEDFHSGEIAVEGENLKKLTAAIETERVTNRSHFHGMSYPYFYLLLYYGEGYPWALTIVENGDIALAPELNTDRYKYFDSGEELYQVLQTMKSSP